MAGQTLTEIRALLAAEGIAPRPRFGQNFLIDLNLMRKLVEAAELRAGDVVLEVGAGTGSLTEILLERGARVVAVEIDRGLQRILHRRLGDHPRFTLIEADVLETKHRINPLLMRVLGEQLPSAGGARKLAANLPYQIATPLLMDLLSSDPPFERLTCTIQKEVGERLVARHNSGDYGPVSVIVQTLAQVELLAVLPPQAFWPRPKVESVMLRIRPRPPETLEPGEIADFVAFVQRAFLQRRKMLRTALRDQKALDLASAFERAGVSPDARPEDLSPGAWQEFFRAAGRSGHR
jgi:16S rRNA (adenine1518-N6/adenine1519-N6)-dimethyltransferase